jgi:hypothetical protein
MKNNKVHIAFNDSQAALLNATALAEGRTVGNLVKSAALQYAVQHKMVIIKPVEFVKHVAPKLDPIV